MVQEEVGILDIVMVGVPPKGHIVYKQIYSVSVILKFYTWGRAIGKKYLLRGAIIKKRLRNPGLVNNKLNNKVPKWASNTHYSENC